MAEWANLPIPSSIPRVLCKIMGHRYAKGTFPDFEINVSSVHGTIPRSVWPDSEEILYSAPVSAVACLLACRFGAV
ncbi:hypothetical protein N7457_000339 [Penicillium paradoxum]|uniref:uncharacterized protein n=1 Tax=Penicillium paradoxum TaxID=176176 RepID=UPI002548D9E9|nr:uncharacterized protein N7457_000339 [Penicillium paradoxum]KAJ5793740.1 hypothetical protein N7457_000339 [Penicillium paradoxum]